MIFRHCWKCMLEVTPSGRAFVARMGPSVSLAPTTPERMAAMCKSSQAARNNAKAWGWPTVEPVTPPPVEIDWGMQSQDRWEVQG